jgi:hypothetical protein
VEVIDVKSTYAIKLHGLYVDHNIDKYVYWTPYKGNAKPFSTKGEARGWAAKYVHDADVADVEIVKLELIHAS